MVEHDLRWHNMAGPTGSMRCDGDGEDIFYLIGDSPTTCNYQNSTMAAPRPGYTREELAAYRHAREWETRLDKARVRWRNRVSRGVRV